MSLETEAFIFEDLFVRSAINFSPSKHIFKNALCSMSCYFFLKKALRS